MSFSQNENIMENQIRGWIFFLQNHNRTWIFKKHIWHLSCWSNRCLFCVFYLLSFKFLSFLCFVCWNLTSDLALKLTIKFSQSLALNQVSANQTLTIADKRWNQRKWLSETKNVVNETRQTKQKHTQKTETCRQRLRWIYSSSPLDQVGQDSQQGCHLCGRRRLEMRGDHWELEPVNSSYLVLNSDLFFCSNLLKKVLGGTGWYLVVLGQ